MRVSISIGHLLHQKNESGLGSALKETLQVQGNLAGQTGLGSIWTSTPLEFRKSLLVDDCFNAVQEGELERLGAEVETEQNVHLHSSVLAFMDKDQQVSHVAETNEISEEFARGVVGDGLNPDICLHLGEHATLVFERKEDLRDFLEQCAKLREDLEEHKGSD